MRSILEQAGVSISQRGETCRLRRHRPRHNMRTVSGSVRQMPEEAQEAVERKSITHHGLGLGHHCWTSAERRAETSVPVKRRC